ncbi:SUMF1/EgtB/PvdO family nonheme iron enzyme, partial [Zoogloea sp.]|uniref:formylglycine-generating enzyme family protein n=1 Tax=Zoogloea sp. TaxID=49181 RepID=UPI00261C4F9C
FAAECRPQGGLGCPGTWPPPGKPDSPPRQPARFLSWAQAEAYCRWAGARLPSEVEWEKAARGEDGRPWPWGNQPDPSRFQGRSGTTGTIAEVGSHPAGESPYGIADLAGNLWEFTATPWGPGQHVMKGGSYLNPLMEVRSSFRWTSSLEDTGADYLGFRCVLDMPRRTAPTP